MLLEVPVEPPEPVLEPLPDPDPDDEPDDEPDDPTEEDEEPPPPPPPQEVRINKAATRNVDQNLFMNFSLFNIDNTTKSRVC